MPRLRDASRQRAARPPWQQPLGILAHSPFPSSDVWLLITGFCRSRLTSSTIRTLRCGLGTRVWLNGLTGRWPVRWAGTSRSSAAGFTGSLASTRALAGASKTLRALYHCRGRSRGVRVGRRCGDDEGCRRGSARPPSACHDPWLSKHGIARTSSARNSNSTVRAVPGEDVAGRERR